MEINTKKNKFLLIVSIVLLVVSFAMITYAYFKEISSAGKSVDTIMGTEKIDTEIISLGKDLYIYAHTYNFGEDENMGSLSDKTETRIILRKADGQTECAVGTYYVYVMIEENDFVYSTEDNKMELVLKLYDQNGDELTGDDISFLEYKTVTDKNGKTFSGFDITTYRGVIPVKRNVEIKSCDSEVTTVQYWSAEIIFVNYDEDQLENEGKYLDGSLVIRHDSYKADTDTELNIAVEDDKVENVQLLINGVDEAEELSVSLTQGEFAVLKFTPNSNYYVRSLSGCPYTPTYNDDGVSLASVKIDEFYNQITNCTVNFEYH